MIIHDIAWGAMKEIWAFIKTFQFTAIKNTLSI